MNATIHIRKSDEAKWKAIGNKSKFIHNVLNLPKSKMEQIKADAIEYAKDSFPDLNQPIKTKQDAQKAVDQITYKKTGSWGA